ncbi:hypothetical protein [Nostoc sp.]|uniref:hypothetical protein n=1 Tax=Nostoc sp. TaxID=1180 RepID=UPI002FFD166B
MNETLTFYSFGMGGLFAPCCIRLFLAIASSQRFPVCKMRGRVGVQIPQSQKSASISTPASI